MHFGTMSYSNAKLNAQEQFHLWLQLYLVTSGPDFPSIDLKNYYLIKFPEA